MPRKISGVRIIRGLMAAVGWQVFRARGGVFICPIPRASDGQQSTAKLKASKIHLGCGDVRLDGFTNVDIAPSPAVDVIANISHLPMFESNSAVEIRLSAVYEHLFRFERLAAAREWFRILRPKGQLAITFIPDFDVLVAKYSAGSPGILRETFDVDEVYRYTHGDPVPHNAPEQLHKDIFTKKSVERELREVGFEIVEIANVCFADEGIALNINVLARKPG